jgi:hypothetical protein
LKSKTTNESEVDENGGENDNQTNSEEDSASSEEEYEYERKGNKRIISGPQKGKPPKGQKVHRDPVKIERE